MVHHQINLILLLEINSNFVTHKVSLLAFQLFKHLATLKYPCVGGRSLLLKLALEAPFELDFHRLDMTQ